MANYLERLVYFQELATQKKLDEETHWYKIKQMYSCIKAILQSSYDKTDEEANRLMKTASTNYLIFVIEFFKRFDEKSKKFETFTSTLDVFIEFFDIISDGKELLRMFRSKLVEFLKDSISNKLKHEIINFFVLLYGKFGCNDDGDGNAHEDPPPEATSGDNKITENDDKSKRKPKLDKVEKSKFNINAINNNTNTEVKISANDEESENESLNQTGLKSQSDIVSYDDDKSDFIKPTRLNKKNLFDHNKSNTNKSSVYYDEDDNIHWKDLNTTKGKNVKKGEGSTRFDSILAEDSKIVDLSKTGSSKKRKLCTEDSTRFDSILAEESSRNILTKKGNNEPDDPELIPVNISKNVESMNDYISWMNKSVISQSEVKKRKPAQNLQDSKIKALEQYAIDMEETNKLMKMACRKHREANKRIKKKLKKSFEKLQ